MRSSAPLLTAPTGHASHQYDGLACDTCSACPLPAGQHRDVACHPPARHCSPMPLAPPPHLAQRLKAPHVSDASQAAQVLVKGGAGAGQGAGVGEGGHIGSPGAGQEGEGPSRGCRPALPRTRRCRQLLQRLRIGWQAAERRAAGSARTPVPPALPPPTWPRSSAGPALQSTALCHTWPAPGQPHR